MCLALLVKSVSGDECDTLVSVCSYGAYDDDSVYEVDRASNAGLRDVVYDEESLAGLHGFSCVGEVEVPVYSLTF